MFWHWDNTDIFISNMSSLPATVVLAPGTGDKCMRMKFRQSEWQWVGGDCAREIYSICMRGTEFLVG